MMLLLLCVAFAQESSPVFNEVYTGYTAEQAQEVSDMRCSVVALELFLEDKSNYEEYCPQLEWIQPDIEAYKKSGVSQLPASCIPKKDPITEPPPESLVVPPSDGS